MIPKNIEINDFVCKGLNAYYFWQSLKPELADNRFKSQTTLNNYLAGFSNPKNIFEGQLLRPTDRFSWIVNNYTVLENAFHGVTLNNGIEFGLVRHKTTMSNVLVI